MPNVRRLLARQRHDLRRCGRLLPALLPRAGDVHHRPVRAQPRRGRQLLPVRLVRDEGPPQHPAALAPEGRLPHRADRQVAERLRRARRPRRGARRLRHLARSARCLGLRLLQLRDEPERQAQDLGRRRLRAQAREVREHRGDAQPRRPGGCGPQAPGGVRARPVPLLGHREPQGLLAGRDRRDHRGPRPPRAQVEEAVLHLVGAGGAAPRGRGDDADGRAPAAIRGRPSATCRRACASSCRGRAASTRPTSPTSRRTCATTRRS